MVLETINDDNDDEGSEKYDIRSDQGICGDGEMTLNLITIVAIVMFL